MTSTPSQTSSGGLTSLGGLPNSLLPDSAGESLAPPSSTSGSALADGRLVAVHALGNGIVMNQWGYRSETPKGQIHWRHDRQPLLAASVAGGLRAMQVVEAVAISLRAQHRLFQHSQDQSLFSHVQELLKAQRSIGRDLWYRVRLFRHLT